MGRNLQILDAGDWREKHEPSETFIGWMSCATLKRYNLTQNRHNLRISYLIKTARI